MIIEINNRQKCLRWSLAILSSFLWTIPLHALNPVERELFPQVPVDTLPGMDIHSTYFLGWEDETGNKISSGVIRGSAGIQTGPVMIEAWGEVSNTIFQWDYPLVDITASMVSEAAGFRLTYLKMAGTSCWIEDEHPYLSAFFFASSPIGLDFMVEMGFVSAFSGSLEFALPIKPMEFGSDLLTSVLKAQLSRSMWEMAISLGAGTSVDVDDEDEMLFLNRIPLAWMAESFLAFHLDGLGLSFMVLAEGAKIKPVPASSTYLSSNPIQFTLLSGSARLTTNLPLAIELSLSHLSVPKGEGYFYAKSFSYLLSPFIDDGWLRWSDIAATRIGGNFQGRYALGGIIVVPELGYDAVWLNADTALFRKKNEWVSDGFYFWQGHEVISWPSLAGTDFTWLPDGFIHAEIKAERRVGKHQTFSISIRQYLPVHVSKVSEYDFTTSNTMEKGSGYGGLICSFTWTWKP